MIRSGLFTIAMAFSFTACAPRVTFPEMPHATAAGPRPANNGANTTSRSQVTEVGGDDFVEAVSSTPGQGSGSSESGIDARPAGPTASSVQPTDNQPSSMQPTGDDSTSLQPSGNEPTSLQP